MKVPLNILKKLLHSEQRSEAKEEIKDRYPNSKT